MLGKIHERLSERELVGGDVSAEQDDAAPARLLLQPRMKVLMDWIHYVSSTLPHPYCMLSKSHSVVYYPAISFE